MKGVQGQEAGAADPPVISGADALLGSSTRRFHNAVLAMGILAAGLAVWAVVRMFGDAGPGEILILLTSAWIAWVVVVALRMWERFGASVQEAIAQESDEEPASVPSVAV
ncbi:hypothetical protein ACFQ1E_05440 [Sphingomonas canadensis]|uniref:Uncharacterized protein n=1 Tax=Sphingomonas canadensis TaxID=1219257 RepID=A0ABW3H537_9SPHN|nr:hypothetical protein [Sphingomonas canadensis]MCW3835768.1 hypothetical protein [Sphingomonas canadensis]